MNEYYKKSKVIQFLSVTAKILNIFSVAVCMSVPPISINNWERSNGIGNLNDVSSIDF